MMKKRELISRRQAFKTIAATTALGLHYPTVAIQKSSKRNLKKNIKQSVCHWCYQDMLTVEQLAIEVKKIGLVGIDLVGPENWKYLKTHDLESTMCNGAEISLTEGFNDKQYHGVLVDSYLKHIDLVADAGYKNLICFSGNRREIDDQEGLENCVVGLKRVLSKAEKRGVIIHMELLNSKVDHKDYMCDRTHWGVELCKAIGSENFKLLYDIYHMQVQEGDIIRNIKDYSQYIGHYHTAGNPGRNELDTNQEIYYPAVIRAIIDTGYDGYLAQEFIPKDKSNLGMDSLAHAVAVCDV